MDFLKTEKCTREAENSVVAAFVQEMNNVNLKIHKRGKIVQKRILPPVLKPAAIFMHNGEKTATRPCAPRADARPASGWWCARVP